MTPTRLLSFVNHVAPAAGTEDAIERAFEWGVDAIVAQGTGTDWGPYWLGSGAQPHTNFTENIRPYVRAAVRYEVPFVFSVGVAGGRPQLEACLTQIDALCREEEMSLTLGVIDTEIDPEYLARAVADGREVPAAYDVPSLSRTLTADDVSEATRIVGLVGPEPIAEMLGRGGLDGVVTGRAVDVALYIALPLQQGLPVAVAAHAAKVIECGGLALEPGDPCLCIWAEIGDESFEVRSPDPRARPTIRGMAAHAFYERANPYREANPGGYLDLSNATYSETDLGVRSSGAQWVDEPYTILVEAAKSEGFRSIVVMGVREPALLEQLDGWITQAEKDIAETDRFADLEMWTATRRA
jgi:hypothetical protein